MNQEIVAREDQPILTKAAVDRRIEELNAFKYFKEKALTKNDVCKIQDRIHICKSGCLSLAQACNVSMELRDERVEVREGERVWHFTYRAIAPSGRFADAVGSASTSERDYSHPDHDCRSLAQTRACSRSILNLVGGGEVSAEEIGATTNHPSPQSPPPIERPYLIDRDVVFNVLENEGLDSMPVDVYPEEGILIIKPREYLGDVWGKYNDVLKGKLGAEWVRAGKEGRWEVRQVNE